MDEETAGRSAGRAGEEPPAAQALPSEVLTHEERTWAMLAYLLKIPAPILGPLVIYLSRKERSRFVRFHALQSLFLDLGLIMVSAGAVAIAFTVQIIPIAGWIIARQLMLTPFLAIVGCLIYTVLMAIKANDGEYGRVPLVADWVDRNLGP